MVKKIADDMSASVGQSPIEAVNQVEVKPVKAVKTKQIPPIEATPDSDTAAPKLEIEVKEDMKIQKKTEPEKPVVTEKPVESNRVVMNRMPSPARPITQVNRAPVQTQRVMTPPPQVAPDRLEPIMGYLDVMPEGQGFVRPNFTPNHKDAVIGSTQIRKYGLRPGDQIVGMAKAPREGEKYWGLVRIDKVNGMDVMSAMKRPEFRELVPIYPQKQLHLETDPKVYSTRIIDLFSPIGFGQRGMVVSPPKAGKTTLLKEIAAGVAVNHPEVHLMAVLVGERPEEVTDMQRFIKGEVIASHFDQKPEEQTRAAEVAIERAKRLVEMGKDVFVVFDSITRLARAYNLAIPTSGRTLSGGFDPAALYPSKRFFGAARKIENGGSLTIIGTALVDTGSKMDELIFEEFKGTGNMELWLLRELAERRIFPAFDILKSGTRNEDLLLDEMTLMKIIAIRRMFDAIGDTNGTTERIIEQLGKTKNNAEFLAKVGKK